MSHVFSKGICIFHAKRGGRIGGIAVVLTGIRFGSFEITAERTWRHAKAEAGARALSCVNSCDIQLWHRRAITRNAGSSALKTAQSQYCWTFRAGVPPSISMITIFMSQSGVLPKT